MRQLSIFLADDDKDDCLFFREALDELSIQALLTTVHNGEHLMQLLNKKTTKFPDVLFMDLNMPRKSGNECLQEIKLNKKLAGLPVVICTTTYDRDIADLLYKSGAHFYICKPAAFSNLKRVIEQALTLVLQSPSQPSRAQFVLSNLKSIPV